MALIEYTTSLRSRPIAETLQIARRYAVAHGISRVTDITRLDRIGLPVYASIRPNAMRGSLCVSAGKGLRPEEAEIGAYMEALELSFAEPGKAGLTIEAKPLTALAGCQENPNNILAYCAVQNAAFTENTVFDAVLAEELFTGATGYIPAELVLLPFASQHQAGRYFGSSSNGLASGNQLTEATLHALLEVAERDIMSFQTVHDASVIVDPTTLPPAVADIQAKINEAGFELVVRHMDNPLGLPYFVAAVIDDLHVDPLYISGGYGCHCYKGIALMRAVTEAVQSRLSYIHGGRDDLADSHRYFGHMSEQQRMAYFSQLTATLRAGNNQLHYGSIGEFAPSDGSLTGLLRALMHHLHGLGFTSMYRVAYTQPHEPIQVVRVVVPHMEFYTKDNNRIGNRLKAYVRSTLDRTVRGA